jgi:hypothetical protein
MKLFLMSSPPPFIGRLRSLMLRMRTASPSLLVTRTTTISRAPTVFVPSGV